MRLIFGKTGMIGIHELQGYFSHIPGTIELEDLRPDIITAQEEVATHVSTAILNKAINCYYSAEFVSQEDETFDNGASGDGSDYTANELNELVYRVQSVVTLMAYRDYAQNNDATHTATGRTARSDKDSDVLNLRLIEADDLAMQRKALKALDRLIKYINEKSFTEWTDSTAYKQTMDLLLWDADQFEKYFPIDHNHRVFQMLCPMIRKAQIDYIFPRVGADVLKEILTKVQTGALITPADLYIYDRMCYPLAELAISEGFAKLPVQLFPEKMVQQLWGPGNGASALVLREKLIRDIELRGFESLRKLENELESRKAIATETPITETTIIDIAERMDAGNLYARV